jgi:TRAP-type C4-dicarboxylate transport system permease small subunit
MKQAFLSFERLSTGLALFVACAMMVVAASLGMYQIITRFILERPAEWTEVLIRFSLIWMVLLAVPAAFRQGAMVCVDALYRWSPQPVRRALEWIVFLASLALMLVVLWWGWDYAQRGGMQTIAGLESLSMFWAYLSLPVGAVFSILGLLGALIDPKREELETAQ